MITGPNQKTAKVEVTPGRRLTLSMELSAKRTDRRMARCGVTSQAPC